jgi:hypothetical protein
MLWTFDSRNLGSEVAMVLEKVEVSPSILFEVMGLAESTALRAGILGSPISSDLQMEHSGCFFGIEMLTHDFPRSRKPQTQGKDFFCKHDEPSCREGYLSTSN